MKLSIVYSYDQFGYSIIISEKLLRNNIEVEIPSFNTNFKYDVNLSLDESHKRVKERIEELSDMYASNFNIREIKE